mmetsp:Transcript_54238/g.129271  ORF Transcript_54238/g.129271 Transcript_54238/m.129271 type:complete len:445 (+) Transcript_54238:56-1390(+)
MASWSLPSVQFLAGNPDADAEIKQLGSVGLVIMMAMGFIGYKLFKTTLLPQRVKMLLMGCFLPLFIIGPFAVLSIRGPCKALMAHFSLSFFGVMGFFKWLELMCGTGPRGSDTSLGRFVLYFTSPAEVLFDEEGKLAKAPPGQMQELLLSFAGHTALATIILSLGRETGFSPFLGCAVDPLSLPFFGLPRSLPAIYLQAMYVYCMLAQALITHRAPLALFGIATRTPMRQPMWLSTSARDYWGRRWNLIVHHLMKRTFFTPFATRKEKAWRHVGGILAFVMSGLFHEYMWAAVNWPNTDQYIPGLAVLFFLVQYAICAVEVVLERTTLGKWATTWPRPLKTVVTTAIVLPWGPLFLHGINGMAIDCSEWGQTVKLSWDPSTEQRGSLTPPLDWVLMLIMAVFFVAHGRWQKRRQRFSTMTSPACKVVPCAGGGAIPEATNVAGA